MRLSRKDLLLVLLYAPSSEGAPAAEIRGRTRFAKMVFLFSKEVWPKHQFERIITGDDLPEFFAWNFGPFSKQVFEDLGFLQSIGFITAEAGGPAPVEEARELEHWSDVEGADLQRDPETEVQEYSEQIFRVTELGRRYVETNALWDKLSQQQQAAIVRFKHQLSRAPLYTILKYVYERYPAEAAQSHIKERILGP